MGTESTAEALSQRPPRVFLSYSHDSPEHAARVLGLALQLRRDGVDARIDQFDAFPPEGWPQWCARQILDSDYVALICTATYRERFLGYEKPDTGRGVKWEGKILQSILYRDERNTRFQPVVFAKGDERFIPESVVGMTWILLTSFGTDDPGYTTLVRRFSDGRLLAPLPDLAPVHEPSCPPDASVATGEVAEKLAIQLGKLDEIIEGQKKLSAGQQTLNVAVQDLAGRLSQVQEALSRVQQNTDPKHDPISQWSQERLEIELARQMEIEVKYLRAILAAGKTSLDALLQGQALLASGKPKEAGEKFDVVIQQEKDAMKRLRQAYEGKAQIAFDAVKYEEALSFREKAAVLVDKTADPIGWADVHGWVTFIDVRLARYEHAEPLMKEVVRLREEHLRPDDPAIATDLNNLAQLYQATNRLAEAEPLMELALKITEKSYGPEHPNVATILDNLAQLYKATNRLVEAERLMERALKIDEKSYGPEHPDVAVRLNNLAQLYKATNRLAKAESLMKRVTSIFEKSYGPEHPDVATSLNNLAQLYQATNRLAEAEPLLERALEIDEKSYGPEHPDVAVHLNNLAQLYQATNWLPEAEAHLRRAVVMLLKSTHAAGHVVPNLKLLTTNYRLLLVKMTVSESEVSQRIAAAGREAGFTPEEFTKLVQKLGE